MVWLNILLHPDRYCNRKFYSTMCMHTISFALQLQCSQPHMLPHICVRVTTCGHLMLHSPYLLCMRIFVPCKWIHRLCTFSKNSNNLLWYSLRIYRHCPWNGMHSTTYHWAVQLLPAFYGLYWLAIVLRLETPQTKSAWKKKRRKKSESNRCVNFKLNFLPTRAKYEHQIYNDNDKHFLSMGIVQCLSKGNGQNWETDTMIARKMWKFQSFFSSIAHNVLAQ